MTNEPLYQMVATDLAKKIEEGQWGPGVRLPSEKALAEDYAVSSTTIRGAIKELKVRGMLEVRPGSGGYVVGDYVKFVLAQSSFQKMANREGITREGSWATEVRAQGHEPSTRFDCLSTLATSDLSELLSIEEGSPLVIRRSLRIVNDRPVAIEYGYYPAWLTTECPLLAAAEIIPQGTTSFLADNGFTISHHLDTVEARMSTADESEFFEQTELVSCLVRRRTSFAEDKPLRVLDTIYRASMHVLSYEVPN